MKRSSAELKQLARETLKGKYGTFIGTNVIYGLIVFAISLVIVFATIGMSTSTALIVQSGLQFIIAFVMVIFEAGLIYQAMQACREKPIGIKDLFYGFSHNPDRFIVISILTTLLALVFIIPSMAILVIGGALGAGVSEVMMVLGMLLYVAGAVFLIIVSLCVALCFYLILDNPGMKSIEAIKTSWRLMKGHKGRYFYISLSFIGLLLLGVLSFGIALLWIIPYMNVTLAYFYFDVMGALDPPVEEVAAAPVETPEIADQVRNDDISE